MDELWDLRNLWTFWAMCDFFYLIENCLEGCLVYDAVVDHHEVYQGGAACFGKYVFQSSLLFGTFSPLNRNINNFMPTKILLINFIQILGRRFLTLMQRFWRNCLQLWNSILRLLCRWSVWLLDRVYIFHVFDDYFLLVDVAFCEVGGDAGGSLVLSDLVNRYSQVLDVLEKASVFVGSRSWPLSRPERLLIKTWDLLVHFLTHIDFI